MLARELEPIETISNESGCTFTACAGGSPAKILTRLFEVGADTIGGPSDHRHVLLGGSLQFRFRSSGNLGAESVLHVGVQTLVRIEVGCVAWQVEDLDAIGSLGKPGFDWL